jgi:predicted DNA-binding transcriptional regulator AlpA
MTIGDVETPEILSAKEVAKILKCSVSFVYQQRKSGGLAPRFKFGEGRKGWRWSRNDVDAFIKGHEIPGDSEDISMPDFIPVDLTRRRR